VLVDVAALKVHMSEHARGALVAYPEFITEPRGDINVKVHYFHAVKLNFLRFLCCT